MLDLGLQNLGFPQHHHPNDPSQRVGYWYFRRVNQWNHLHSNHAGSFGREGGFKVVGEGKEHGSDTGKVGDLVGSKHFLEQLLGRTQDCLACVFFDGDGPAYPSGHSLGDCTFACPKRKYLLHCGALPRLWQVKHGKTRVEE